MTTGAQLATTMLAHVGKTQYIWGGTTWKPGVDCSGSIYRSLLDLGLHLERYTAQSFLDWCANAGKQISIAQAKTTVGALLFVGPRHGIHHVAVSLGGPANNPSTVEAANPTVDMIVGKIGTRFNYAGLIPILTFGAAPPPPPPPPNPGVDYAALRRFVAGTLASQMGALPTPIENSTLPGPNIKILQQALNIIFPDAHIAESSTFDGPTAFCVSAFQQNMNKLKPGAITDTFPGVFSNATKFWIIVSLDNIAAGKA